MFFNVASTGKGSDMFIIILLHFFYLTSNANARAGTTSGRAQSTTPSTWSYPNQRTMTYCVLSLVEAMNDDPVC